MPFSNPTCHIRDTADFTRLKPLKILTQNNLAIKQEYFGHTIFTGWNFTRIHQCSGSCTKVFSHCCILGIGYMRTWSIVQSTFSNGRKFFLTEWFIFMTGLLNAILFYPAHWCGQLHKLAILFVFKTNKIVVFSVF